MNKRRTGAEKETLACRYLEERGVRIVERNYRTRAGEIDIIGLHEGFLVFVEVKYRTDLRCGFPEEAVTCAKQRTICRTAQWYIFTHEQTAARAYRGVRYDVVGMLGDQIRWTKNAFDHLAG